MEKISKIHTRSAGHRIHYLPEWMEKRGIRQVDIVKTLDVSKSNVSKWVAGSVMPEPKRLIALAELLKLDDVAALFRHPDDDWLRNIFKNSANKETLRNATPEQVEEIKNFANYVLSKKAG